MALGVGIGLSTNEDPYRAAQEAVEEASRAVPEPGLAIAFASIHHDQEKVVAGLTSRLDPRILMGGSSYAEISNGGVTKRSIIVMLLAFDDVKVRIGDMPSSGEALRDSSLMGEDGPFRKVGLLVRSIADGSGLTMLREIKGGAGPLPMFGGLTSGDYDKGLASPDFWKNYQYVDGKVQATGSRLAVLDLPRDDYHVAFGFSHGWTEIGPEVVLDRCEGNLVYQVGGIPIFDYYRQFLDDRCDDAFFEKMVTRYGFATKVTCEGQSRTVIKIPVACDMEQGWIKYFPEDDMQGMKVQLIQASRRGVLQGSREAAARCEAALRGERPDLVLVVSCCTRNSILVSRLGLELDVVQEVFGRDVPIFGFYSGGELIPYLSRYEDVADISNPFSGSHFHATTIGVMAIKSRRPPLAVHVPARLDECRSIEEEVEMLRRRLVLSDDILDSTEGFLTSLSQMSYRNAEKLKVQNDLLATKNRHNEKLQEVIHRYTPHDIWEQLGASVARGEYELADSEILATFMFMDVKGFTSFSENHEPGEVVAVLNEIFQPATEIFYRHDGDVDKFIGDCIFSVFRTPEAAVRSAYEVLEKVQTLQASGNPFTIRIGINGGRAIRANVGGTGRREYTYIGDAVNLAQRMESSALPGHALIAAGVARQLTLPFPRVEMREVTVKGKLAPVVAYECGL